MVRTQIYLSEPEVEALQRISRETKRSQSELIREAIDRWVATFERENARRFLDEARGMWNDHRGLSFEKLRKGWERRHD